MFGKKPESRHLEDKPGQVAILEIPDRTPRPNPVNQSAPLSMKASNASQASAPIPIRPSIAGEGSAPSPVKSSVISDGFEFTGDMKSDGSLTVDGVIRGNLVVRTLLIGATGLVDGSVKADSINVEGRLSGAAECKDLAIGGRAVVDGQLGYNTITIQRGGTIKGDLKRG